MQPAALAVQAMQRGKSALAPAAPAVRHSYSSVGGGIYPTRRLLNWKTYSPGRLIRAIESDELDLLQFMWPHFAHGPHFDDI